MTQRVLNFNPGPATLPLPVLESVRDELTDYAGTGMSILEHSHRGKDYAAVHQEAKSLLRDLLAVPESHDILFMQGGASAQFALVPMNFLREGASADYVMTGAWSDKAFAEAKLLGAPRVAATTKGEDGVYRRIPKQEELDLSAAATYVHVTTNNTIFGTQFHYVPDTGSVPLVADMSSDILCRPLDVSRFDLIYAGAQKNLGPAGITVVILRRELAERARTDIPKIFRYATIIGADSLQNTIPTFSVYLVRNVLRWVRDQGGAAAMGKRNQEKADTLYGAIDAHADFFRCDVERESRSTMNVVFRLPKEELEAKFVEEAKAKGMVGLKGHRSVGGIRVSMYNAMEPAGVAKLAEFMSDFQKQNA